MNNSGAVGVAIVLAVSDFRELARIKSNAPGKWRARPADPAKMVG
jgi:hypothetical protein